MFVKSIDSTSLVTIVDEDAEAPLVGKDAPSIDNDLGKKSRTHHSEFASLLVDSEQDAKEFSEINRNETAPVSSNYRIQFSTSKESRRTSIAIIDKDSGKIIREIPSEKLLKITERIQQSIGLIFDSKI